MRLHDPLCDRETEPEPAALRGPRARAIGPPEAVEDVWQIVGGDSDARVPNGDRDFIVAAPRRRQLHMAAARRVLDRVRDDVEEQLPESRSIAHDRRRFER